MMQQSKKVRYIIVLFLLGVSFVAVVGWNICVGTDRIPLADIFASIRGEKIENSRILWDIRMPRTLAAMILGGALALAVANEVWMLENAIYSILSPEGFASILWKDSKKAPDAARVMKITAADLYERGLIEQVIPEQEPASIETMPELAEHMRQSMTAFFERYSGKTKEAIRESRYQRFRNM